MRLRVLEAGLITVLGVCSPVAAVGQKVTPVPNLDLNRFMGVWHEQARLPIGIEKPCIGDSTVLYALGTKPNSFQEGIFCTIKDAGTQEWAAKGKYDKQRDGRIKEDHIWPFYKKYWVLAVGPSYDWALVGSPNHKALWILSRSSVMDSSALAALEAQASAQGFHTAKLIRAHLETGVTVAEGTRREPLTTQNDASARSR